MKLDKIIKKKKIKIPALYPAQQILQRPPLVQLIVTFWWKKNLFLFDYLLFNKLEGK